MKNKDISPDIIIIGAGIIGCATAYELAKRKLSVLVIEKGQVGQEASSAAAGMLSAQVSHAVEDLPLFFSKLQLESRSLFPKIVRELEGETGLSVGYQKNGILYLIFKEKELTAIRPKIRWQQKNRLAVEWLSPERVRRKEPAVDGSILGAFYFPDDPQVNNQALTLAYAKAGAKKGTRFLQGDAANRILLEKSKVAGVRTGSGKTFYSRIVLNTCGSWAEFDKHLPFKIPVFPARGQVLTYRFGKLPFKTPVVSSQGYCVPREGNRLLVGTTVEFGQSKKRVTSKGIRQILSGVSHFTSCLQGRTPYEKWAGLRPCTPDHLPILGKTPIEGLYAATGHFRDGILLAPITAKLMTELVIKRRPSIPLKSFSLSRLLPGKA